MPGLYDRQIGIINILEYSDNSITIVGCGAVGSFAALALAKMGIMHFELYDHDTVELHNIPNQLFSHHHIGKHKVEATAVELKLHSKPASIVRRPIKFDSQFINSQIVLCSVDTMAARKKVFAAAKKSKMVQLFFDTRMAGLQAQLYTIDMKDKKEVKYYESTLFSDEEAVQERCTERAIIFPVLGLASLVCCNVVKALQGKAITNFITIDYTVPQMM